MHPSTALDPSAHSLPGSASARILGSGLMQHLVRAFDWSSTSLGPIAGWSDTLVATLNQLLHSPLPATLSWGPDLIFFYNEASIPTLGAKHPTALGQSYYRVFAEAWDIVGPDLTACLRDGHTPVRENILIPILRDGYMQDQYWTYSLVPIFDNGAIAGIFNAFQNVTDTVLATRERDAAIASLDQFLGATRDAVVAIDRNWNISYLNAAAKATYSAGRSLLGRPIWQEFPHAFYHGSPYVEHYTRAMDHNLPGSFEAHYPDPLNLWLQVEVYPTQDGIVTFSRDISERRRAEAALLQSEKLAAVGRMASAMAHEINNPLEAITNLLYLARNSSQLSHIHRMLDLADNELRRVSLVASQNLRFHRQTSSARQTTCNELFTLLLTMYEGKIRNNGIQVSKRKRATRPVRLFEGDIRQALSNIIGNAIDAMPHGGRLLVRSRHATHWPSARSGLMLTIADTGCGIPPAILDRVFEAFFTTKGIGGTGLGLWISKEILERHGGALRIRSSQSPARHGTVVTLFVPFEPPPAPTPA